MQIKHFIQKSSLKEIGQQFKKKQNVKKTHNVLPGAVSTAAAANWTKWEVTSKESQKAKRRFTCKLLECDV